MKKAIICTIIFIIAACHISWAKEETLEDLLEEVEEFIDVSTSVVAISRKEIEEYGYTSLQEILENMTGLYMIDDYAWTGSPTFGVRGFLSPGHSNDIIIMVNGVNQLEDYWNSYSLSRICVPVEAIDKIEVIRGPMSVEYGSGAFFGAINIITNKANDNEFMRMLSTSIGSENTYKAFSRMAGNSNQLKYVFNGSIYRTSGLDVPYKDMLTNPELLATPFYPPEGLFGYNMESQNETTKNRLENQKRYFNLSTEYNSFSVDISHNETKKEMSFFFPSVGDGSQSYSAATNVSLLYKRNLSDRVSMKGKFGYFFNRFTADYTLINEDYYGFDEIHSNAYEVSLESKINLSHEMDLDIGLFRRSAFEIRHPYNLSLFAPSSYRLLPSEEEIANNALFLQLNYRPLHRLVFVAGGRIEQIEKYNMEWSTANGTELQQKYEGSYDQDDFDIMPRFAAIYSLNENNTFKLLYGTAIKRPSFSQNLDMLEHPEKEQLKPAEIRTIELNYRLAFSSKFSVSISAFRNELEKLIIPTYEFIEQDKVIFWHKNAGEMTTNGLELTLKLRPIPNFHMEMSATYQDIEDESAGHEDVDLAYSPQILGYAKAAYHLPYNITLGLNGRYVDEMESAWEITRDFPAGHRIGEKIDSYFVLDGNLRFDDIYKKGIYLNIRGTNILDEQIYYPTTTNNAWADKGTLGNGVSFLTSIGWKF